MNCGGPGTAGEQHVTAADHEIWKEHEIYDW
jgi:hypothetical protein